jgi:hypothetical protein
MRRLLLLFAFFLFCASNAFADCVKCSTNYFTHCNECAETIYNANVLCTLLNNGASCYAQGGCNGPAGDECPHLPCPYIKYVDLSSETIKPQRDWQLVSVKILRGTDATKDGKQQI